MKVKSGTTAMMMGSNRKPKIDASNMGDPGEIVCASQKDR